MKAGLSKAEKDVLALLVKATNAYFALAEEHPVERDEWVLAVHRLQDLIGIRVARRVDPDVWRQPS